MIMNPVISSQNAGLAYTILVHKSDCMLSAMTCRTM